MNTRLPIAWNKFIKSLQNIKKDNNEIDLSKEEIILSRLEVKLGKSRDEVNKIMSKNLMALLVQVPFDK
jgi:hypothetical protein